MGSTSPHPAPPEPQMPFSKRLLPPQAPTESPEKAGFLRGHALEAGGRCPAPGLQPGPPEEERVAGLGSAGHCPVRSSPTFQKQGAEDAEKGPPVKGPEPGTTCYSQTLGNSVKSEKLVCATPTPGCHMPPKHKKAASRLTLPCWSVWAQCRDPGHP